MEYYSATKGMNWVRWMNLEPVVQSKVTQKEEKQISYINIHKWNLEKWYWWTYFQGKNRDADIENRLVGTGGEGEEEAHR